MKVALAASYHVIKPHERQFKKGIICHRCSQVTDNTSSREPSQPSSDLFTKICSERKPNTSSDEFAMAWITKKASKNGASSTLPDDTAIPRKIILSSHQTYSPSMLFLDGDAMQISTKYKLIFHTWADYRRCQNFTQKVYIRYTSIKPASLSFPKQSSVTDIFL